MRLLQVDENGTFSLTDDLVSNIPPYAILSHTWAEDHEEVSFRDLTIEPRKAKSGYKKLRFCAERAAQDNLQHFWVDTCCIDKSNNTELSEAINSMFRWYRDAMKCYVYLSDVSISTHDQLNPALETWEPAFRKSRWFTRGWTLQELLAPSSVEFFCSNKVRLGDKESLEKLLHEITGIACTAFQGTPLSEFSIDERMSWAETRQTKREEDRAYSLLGIFGIHIPLIYGEGGASAFRRLYEEIDKRSHPRQDPSLLDRLPCATEAPFNSYTKQHEPLCLPNTRVDLLREIYNWVDGQDERPIFWLNGLAGTGKSTIARTVARYYFDKKRLGASFFFSRGSGDIRHAGKFATSIAVQLATSIPALRQYINDAVMETKDIASQSLHDQWRELVLRPLLKLDSNGSRLLYVVVIDALDESDDENDIQTILHLLAEVRLLERARLRVLLTSRPEIPIRHGFRQISDKEYLDFVLHNISPLTVDHDITIFLEYNLKLIREERSLDTSWPGDEVIRCLVQAASGLFIWAATACRFVREGKRHAARRLDAILKSSGSASTITVPERHLDEIYTTVLKHSIPSEYTDEEKEESYRMLRQVLGSIVILFATLSLHSLSKLLSAPYEDLDQTVEDLHSILNVPKDKTQPLRLHHPSFRDFLLKDSRCQEPNLRVEEKHAHKMLAEGCIRLMSACMKQDMCDLGAPGKLASDIDTSRVEQYLPPELQYACLYWIPHLQQSSLQLRDNDHVHQFLQKHLLHWLEALGWMGKISDGILAISSLETQIIIDRSPKLQAFIYDIKRFALYNRLVIEQAPLQLYCSALVFAPENSIVRRQFEIYIPAWIKRKPKVQADWRAVLQTLAGHSGSVHRVAFSSDDKQVMSGSHDGTVRVWEVATGAVLRTLEGHHWDSVHSDTDSIHSESYEVHSIAFSPDSKQVVSGSHDMTIQVWDMVTGAVLQTLDGHTDRVNSVAFSPDSKQIVSGSNDMTIRLWDMVTGAVLHTLGGHHLEPVISVAFSLDGKQVVSGSGDCIVRVWDVVTGAMLQTFEGHSSSVYSVAFSPDGKQVVSASHDGTVRVWDMATGVVLQTFEAYLGSDHWGSVHSVAFSPDGKQVASSSYNNTVWLWDVATGAVLQTLEGHSEPVISVAFSSDGKRIVSGSEDRTLWLWDVAIGAALQRLESESASVRSGSVHSGSVHSVAFSPDGKQAVSGSDDKTVRLWDVATGAALQTLEGHSNWVYSVAFSPDGKQVVSGSEDRTVRLWDVAAGAALQMLESPLSPVYSVAFSPDGKQVVSGLYHRKIRVWDVATGAILQTLEGHFNVVCSVAFSPDGKQVVSSSYDRTVRVWDMATGAALQTLKGHSGWVNSVAFSPDGKQIVSSSDDMTVRLWDVATGAALQTLEGHSDRVYSVAFLPNGKVVDTLSLSNRWLVKGETKLLWLPPDYHATCMAIWNEIVVLGHTSGKLSFLQFNQKATLILG